MPLERKAGGLQLLGGHVGIFPRLVTDERLLDRTSRGPAEQVQVGAGLVVGA
jgi:hypothetical protein